MLGIGFLFILLIILPIENDRKSAKDSNNNKHQLKQQVDQFIQQEKALQGAQIGISIRSADTGELQYEHQGDTRLKPASNLKLLTAAAALSVLGEKYRFSTEIHTDGPMKNGMLDGNLYIKGKGDPTLIPSDLDKIAKDLKKRGIRSVKGNIIGDDTWYDAVRLSQDVTWRDEHFHYGSQISALTISPDKDYDTGTVLVKVTPNEKGEKPSIQVEPETDYIQMMNQAQTVSTDEKENLKIEREHGKNSITVEGEIPAGSNVMKEWIAVWEPTNYVLDLLGQALKEHHITWSGETKPGKTPKEAKAVLAYPSMPLEEILVPFMKLSNNGHGEMFVKEMGKVVHDEGSWKKGLDVLRNASDEIGINTDTSVIRDGSGISHVNMIPANEISKLLYEVQKKDWFDAYVHALPVSGENGRMESGTLKKRLSKLNVRAKTGTLGTVSSLSGYLEGKSGETVIFSIIVNNLLDEDDGPEIEDKIVQFIHEHM
ncbi:D-alanyl-D-alanine carboxypeptidase/D-alanyl-D-alanine endopeptidase [Virgibacillus alimentarius]|uniref:D-alanyl-D-alanine carboxypeptidase/D-alanyl-D-alanine endopeptidase n=1 Tax=Virgibacillus alimentarius TaxID=698769 RepID=UPI0004933006|nr:D-alanyl-D-alanine carboxypeptidase/D-alanyl-D-alanine-endopeptidase [Virgibacillus alimentarius]